MQLQSPKLSQYDFPTEKAMWVTAGKRTGYKCTLCTSVNVGYSSIKNSGPCLFFFSCDNVIRNPCIKDRPCVLTKNEIKSNVAPRKVFLFQMYIVTSALDQTIRWRWEMLLWTREDTEAKLVLFAYVLTFTSDGPKHDVPAWCSFIMLMSSTKNRAGFEAACREALFLPTYVLTTI